MISRYLRWYHRRSEPRIGRSGRRGVCVITREGYTNRRGGAPRCPPADPRGIPSRPGPPGGGPRCRGRRRCRRPGRRRRRGAAHRQRQRRGDVQEPSSLGFLARLTQAFSVPRKPADRTPPRARGFGTTRTGLRSGDQGRAGRTRPATRSCSSAGVPGGPGAETETETESESETAAEFESATETASESATELRDQPPRGGFQGLRGRRPRLSRARGRARQKVRDRYQREIDKQRRFAAQTLAFTM